jgi:uncharacterized protein (TIGR03435 family)
VIRATLFVLLSLSCLAGDVTAQDGGVNRFEVATIKLLAPDVQRTVGVTVYPGGRVVLSGMALKGLIGTAFQLSAWQISGDADWMTSDKYAIEARAPENSGITNFNYTLYDIEDARLRAMLQTLLIDRFHLRVHREPTPIRSRGCSRTSASS